MKKIFKLIMVACLFLSLFAGCSEKDEEPLVILTSLTVDKTTFSVEAVASTELIAVLSNKDWTVHTESIWLTLSPSSGKADSKLSVEISITANQDTESRSAVITITADDKTAEVRIEQKGKVVIPGIEITDEKFKQYLIENFDTDNDGDISTEEAEAVTAIDCSGRDIESLTGLEFFVNLEILNCNSNALTRADISKNLLLTTFSCDSNKIDSLGFAENILLKYLSCSSNELTELDVFNNVTLTEFACSSNKLKNIDVSKNTSLVTFDCSDNELTALDISSNSALTSLICSGNNLTVLDVSKNSSLKKLDCRNNESMEKIILAKDQTIPDLSYDNTTTLEYPAPEKKLVNIPDAKFKAFLVGLYDTDKDGEISENEALAVKEIKCHDRDISTVAGLSSFVNLEVLICSGNKISVIDISENIKLKEIDCANNPLSTINLSENVSLTKLLAYSCNLSALNVESNVNLIELNCSDNKISTLNVEKNTLLQRIHCQKNNLSTLDLRKNLQVKTLNCRDNARLTSLYLEQGFVIETLYINSPPTNIIYPNYATFKDAAFQKYLIDNFDSDKDGKLSEAEVKNVREINCAGLGISSLEGVELFKDLTSLICSGNNLTTIDITSNTALRTFRCDSNQLSKLDVSKNILLETLSCSKNVLFSVNVTSNINLKHLICNGNSLGTLNVNTNTKLETLECQNNLMTLILYLNKNLSLRQVNCKNNAKLRIVYLKPGQTIATLLYDEDTTEIRYLDDSQPQRPEDIVVSIPDSKFKAYLLGICDNDKDGEISEAEAKTVTLISCSSMDISSLSGIENFTNLIRLNCNNNVLTSLDLSDNKKLTEINCYGNKLTSLDVTGCVALGRLICGANDLTSLNVSKNSALTYLDLTNNYITELNVRNNPLLSTIICTGNPSIKIYLNNSQNPTITGAASIEKDDAPGVTFDDTIFERLIILEYDKNNDGIISITEAEAITELFCNNLGIKSLKGIEMFGNLRELDCSRNNISGALDLSNNIKLTHVACSDNEITSLDVSTCASLSFLMCSANKLSSLDLSLNKSLRFLDCEDNTGLGTVKLSKIVDGSITIHKNGSTSIVYIDN